MFYVIHGTDLDGYYITVHEHDETPAVWAGKVCSNIVEAAADLEYRLGCRVDWREPDADAAPDTFAIGEDKPPVPISFG
jgi:hypothetical protein